MCISIFGFRMITFIYNLPFYMLCCSLHDSVMFQLNTFYLVFSISPLCRILQAPIRYESYHPDSCRLYTGKNSSTCSDSHSSDIACTCLRADMDQPRIHLYLEWTIPIIMPWCASTGPVLGRCCQHRTSTGPVLATNGMFTGDALEDTTQ